MRKLVLFAALAVISMGGCQERERARIRFCADISPEQPCIGEDTVFIQGRNVWTQLWLRPGFDHEYVTGYLYGYQDGERIFIESLVHELSPNQQVIMEAMFFNNKGRFEVEFRDSQGKLLDKRGFEIW
jgi:hypothetical protein